MKAVVYTKYGLPNVLQLQEVEKPIPKDHEVLVKIHAVSVNSWDWDLLTGKPFLYRLLSGLSKPKFNILGSDIAGRVEAVGQKVTHFKPGDAVFGDICNSWGGFAEYVCAPENLLMLKPQSMSFEQAAAIPQAAVLAWQALQDIRPVKRGDKVLINGAGGGVGTFAIQMAKALGAEVSAVDSAEKLTLLQSLGADHVIDYKLIDFTNSNNQYHLIIDVVAHHSIFQYKKALLPNGILVVVGGKISSIFQAGVFGSLLSVGGSKKMGILMHKPNKNLEMISQLFESGKVVPVIDKCYKLNEVPEALLRIGKGRVQGKIVISVV